RGPAGPARSAAPRGPAPGRRQDTPRWEDAGSRARRPRSGYRRRGPTAPASAATIPGASAPTRSWPVLLVPEAAYQLQHPLHSPTHAAELRRDLVVRVAF